MMLMTVASTGLLKLNSEMFMQLSVTVLSPKLNLLVKLDIYQSYRRRRANGHQPANDHCISRLESVCDLDIGGIPYAGLHFREEHAVFPVHNHLLAPRLRDNRLGRDHQCVIATAQL